MSSAPLGFGIVGAGTIAGFHAQAIAQLTGARLVGVARAITDYSYCCYLSDLAVDEQYQRQSIGQRLVAMLREKLGEQVSLLLISAPGAVDYYPKLGFEKSERAYLIPRSQ